MAKPSRNLNARRAYEFIQSSQVRISASRSYKALPEILVSGSRSLNADIERTSDDVQPYVVIDRHAIEQSCASTAEQLLSTHLAMTYSRKPENLPQTPGNGSSRAIDLRGLGTAETLILIDGRRTPPRSIGEAELHADINSIPLSAIERIEVLPATASAIYGGSATGGGVNIILKRDYSGSHVRIGYEDLRKNSGEPLASAAPENPFCEAIKANAPSGASNVRDFLNAGLPTVGLASRSTFTGGYSTSRSTSIRDLEANTAERIEALSATASGIYGGSATSGVINTGSSGWSRPYYWARLARMACAEAARLDDRHLSIEWTPPCERGLVSTYSIQTPGATYYLGWLSPDGKPTAVYELTRYNRSSAAAVSSLNSVSPTTIWFDIPPDDVRLEESPVWVSDDESIYPVKGNVIRVRLRVSPTGNFRFLAAASFRIVQSVLQFRGDRHERDNCQRLLPDRHSPACRRRVAPMEIVSSDPGLDVVNVSGTGVS